MRVSRFAAIVVSALALTTAANAGDGWRIVESAGAVKVGGAKFTPVAVSPNQTLPIDSWVETAASGRVVLVRGAESIAVGPNSRIYLPDEEVNGNTQVLQTLGSALYQIGKQKAPHFQVDTPYLAAVVKGTTFTVDVAEQAATVDVTEGVVEVATPDRSAVELVRAGFSGVVSRDHRGSVVVAPKQQENNGTAPARKTAKDQSARNDRVVIPAIGETNVDVKDVSGGLASNAVTPALKSVNDVAKDRVVGDVTNAGGGVVSTVVKTVDVIAVQPIAVDVAPGVVDVVAGPITGGVSLDVAAPAVDVGVDLGTPVVGVGVDAGVGAGGTGVAVDVVAPVLDVGVGVQVGGVNGNGGVGAGNGSGVGLGVGVGVGVGNGGLGVGVSLGGGAGGGISLGLGLGKGK